MDIKLQTFSYRFAEQVLNSQLVIKQQIEAVLTHESLDLESLSRPNFNKQLDKLFVDQDG